MVRLRRRRGIELVLFVSPRGLRFMRRSAGTRFLLDELARIIHERFYYNRGYAAATGRLAARSLDILFQVCLTPSRFHVPVSRRVFAISSRTVMNNAG